MDNRQTSTFYTRWLKRSLDIVGSGIALCMLAPVFAAVALLVRVRVGSPVIFRQTRPGLAGAPFELVKFRTMSDRVDSSGHLLSDEERLDGFGRFLRSASLDELPELWNVFTGEMSLVGPRPLLMQYLERYTPRQRRRQEVRPGITGLAQVSGRNALDWERKFELDVEYVESYSLRLDVQIISRTFAVLLRRDGIAHDGYATAPEFMGKDGSS